MFIGDNHVLDSRWAVDNGEYQLSDPLVTILVADQSASLSIPT